MLERHVAVVAKTTTTRLFLLSFLSSGSVKFLIGLTTYQEVLHSRHQWKVSHVDHFPMPPWKKRPSVRRHHCLLCCPLLLLFFFPDFLVVVHWMVEAASRVVPAKIRLELTFDFVEEVYLLVHRDVPRVFRPEFR